MKSTWTKEAYSGKDFNKILVVGASSNLSSRAAFENRVVQLLQQQGIASENSINNLPRFENIEESSEEEIARVVRDGNFDGLIVASLVDVNSKEILEGYGGRAYPYGMYGSYGFGYSYYISSSYSYSLNEAYYRQEKTYVIEARLYDAEAPSTEEALVWAGQSKLTDPSSFESGAKSFAKTTVRALLKEGLVY
jgi:hypothetical protein